MSYKPGSVSQVVTLRPPVIYLRWPSPTTSSDLPLGSGKRAALLRDELWCRYMRSCNPSCVEPANVTIHRGGLLPRHFTLTATRKHTAVCFCYALQTLADLFPLGRTALFVARTFLSRLIALQAFESLFAGRQRQSTHPMQKKGGRGPLKFVGATPVNYSPLIVDSSETVSFLRPLARRAAKTLRPLGVDIL